MDEGPHYEEPDDEVGRVTIQVYSTNSSRNDYVVSVGENPVYLTQDQRKAVGVQEFLSATL